MLMRLLHLVGKVDNLGRFVFAELSGRVGWLKPDGEQLAVCCSKAGAISAMCDGARRVVHHV